MNEKTKESKFLDAINKYAEHQKAQITQEIEEYKNSKIEQATEQGLQDAYDLIHEDVSKRKSAIVNDLAIKQLHERNELFAERQSICDKVFEEASNKLRDFVKTEDYTRFLQRSLKEIADLCGSDSCEITISPNDENKQELIKSVIPEATVSADSHITLGGIKAYCPEKGVLMDDTLDTRLNEQRRWFVENSGLKVV